MPTVVTRIWMALAVTVAALLPLVATGYPAGAAATVTLTGSMLSTALSTALFAAALLLAARVLGGFRLPGSGRSTGGVRLRARTRRTPPVRLCDPDAAGRPRPRAPGTYPLA